MNDKPEEKNSSSKNSSAAPAVKTPADPSVKEKTGHSDRSLPQPVPLRDEPFQDTGRRRNNINMLTINRLVVLGLVLVLAFAVFPIIKIFFVPVVVAATFATLFHPFYRRILKVFRNNRAVSAFICSLVLFVGLVTPTYLVVNLVVKQAVELYQTAQPTIRDIVERGGHSELMLRVQEFPLVRWLQLSTINLTIPLNEGVKTLATTGTKLFNKTSAGVIGLFLNIFIMFFTMFYFFMDGEEMVRKLRHLFPIHEDYKELIVNRFLLISRAAVMGTVVIGVTQGTLGALLLLFCGIKSWLMWGFVMIILATIPLLGAWSILIPTGIIQLILGNTTTGIVIIAVSMVVISSMDNLIRPRLVGQGAKLHDLVIFFSSLGGIATFGVMGFIVGPVIAALFVAVLDIYSKEFEQQLGAEEKDK